MATKGDSFLFELIIDLQDANAFQGVQRQMANLAANTEQADGKVTSLSDQLNGMIKNLQGVDDIDLDLAGDGPKKTLAQIREMRDALVRLKKEGADFNFTGAVSKLGSMEEQVQRVNSQIRQMPPAARAAASASETMTESTQDAQIKTSMMTASFTQGLQDMQFGLIGVQNNIEQFVQGLVMNMQKGNSAVKTLSATFKTIFTGPAAFAVIITLLLTLAANFDKVASAVINWRESLETLSYTLRNMVGLAGEAEQSVRNLNKALEETVETVKLQDVVKDMQKLSDETRGAIEAMTLEEITPEYERLTDRVDALRGQQARLRRDAGQGNPLGFENVRIFAQLERGLENILPRYRELGDLQEGLNEMFSDTARKQREMQSAFETLQDELPELSTRVQRQIAAFQTYGSEIDDVRESVEKFASGTETEFERISSFAEDMRNQIADLPPELSDQAEELAAQLGEALKRERLRVEREIQAEILDVRQQNQEETVSLQLQNIRIAGQRRRAEIIEQYGEDNDLARRLIREQYASERREREAVFEETYQRFSEARREIEMEALGEREEALRELEMEGEQRRQQLAEAAEARIDAIRADSSIENQEEAIQEVQQQRERLLDQQVQREGQRAKEIRREWIMTPAGWRKRSEVLSEIRSDFQEQRAVTKQEFDRMKAETEMSGPSQSIFQMVFGFEDPIAQIEQEGAMMEVAFQRQLQQIADRRQNLKEQAETTADPQERERLLDERRRLEREKTMIQQEQQQRRKELAKKATAERIKIIQQGAQELLSNASSAATGYFETWKSARSQELKDEGKSAEERQKILEKEGKRRFQIMKAMKIAEATAAGITATVNAYNAGAQIGGPIVGAAFAATAAAAVAMKIRKLTQLSIGDRVGVGGGGAGGGSQPGGKFTQLNQSIDARRASEFGTEGSRSRNRESRRDNEKMAKMIGKEVAERVPDKVGMSNRVAEESYSVGKSKSEKYNK